jgi:hypothetical protein
MSVAIDRQPPSPPIAVIEEAPTGVGGDANLIDLIVDEGAGEYLAPEEIARRELALKRETKRLLQIEINERRLKLEEMFLSAGGKPRRDEGGVEPNGERSVVVGGMRLTRGKNERIYAMKIIEGEDGRKWTTTATRNDVAGAYDKYAAEERANRLVEESTSFDSGEEELAVRRVRYNVFRSVGRGVGRAFDWFKATGRAVQAKGKEFREFIDPVREENQEDLDVEVENLYDRKRANDQLHGLLERTGNAFDGNTHSFGRGVIVGIGKTKTVQWLMGRAERSLEREDEKIKSEEKRLREMKKRIDERWRQDKELSDYEYYKKGKDEKRKIFKKNVVKFVGIACAVAALSPFAIRQFNKALQLEDQKKESARRAGLVQELRSDEGEINVADMPHTVYKNHSFTTAKGLTLDENGSARFDGTQVERNITVSLSIFGAKAGGDRKDGLSGVNVRRDPRVSVGDGSNVLGQIAQDITLNSGEVLRVVDDEGVEWWGVDYHKLSSEDKEKLEELMMEEDKDGRFWVSGRYAKPVIVGEDSTGMAIVEWHDGVWNEGGYLLAGELRDRFIKQFQDSNYIQIIDDGRFATFLFEGSCSEIVLNKLKRVFPDWDDIHRVVATDEEQFEKSEEGLLEGNYEGLEEDGGGEESDVADPYEVRADELL